MDGAEVDGAGFLRANAEMVHDLLRASRFDLEVGREDFARAVREGESVGVFALSARLSVGVGPDTVFLSGEDADDGVDRRHSGRAWGALGSLNDMRRAWERRVAVTGDPGGRVIGYQFASADVPWLSIAGNPEDPARPRDARLVLAPSSATAIGRATRAAVPMPVMEGEIADPRFEDPVAAAWHRIPPPAPPTVSGGARR